MLARKFVRYRLHMEGITQNKLKSLIFIEAPQGRKSVVGLDQKKKEKEEKKMNMKKINK